MCKMINMQVVTNNKCKCRNKIFIITCRAQGFTLVELIMVILLLGTIATFSTQFIGIGTQIYGDAGHREQLMSDARFAIERLNREIRDAVPGTVRIEDENGFLLEEGPCLYFWAISNAGSYLYLNHPVSSVSSTFELKMVGEEGDVEAGKDFLIVYPQPLSSSRESLLHGCDYGRCVVAVMNVEVQSSGERVIQYNDGHIDSESPEKRLYVAREQVRYCIKNKNLYRSVAPIFTEKDDLSLGILMAESLVNSSYFYREPLAFNAQNVVGIKLHFQNKDELVIFNHKVEVVNVP